MKSALAVMSVRPTESYLLSILKDFLANSFPLQYTLHVCQNVGRALILSRERKRLLSSSQVMSTISVQPDASCVIELDVDNGVHGGG